MSINRTDRSTSGGRSEKVPLVFLGLLLLRGLLFLFRRKMVTDCASSGRAKDAVMGHVSSQPADDRTLDTTRGLRGA